jgi:hypothetical protein
VIFVNHSKISPANETPVLIFLFVGLALASPLVFPITISWDGFLYLGSGHAILHDEMASQYHWLRDPLYPLLVGVLNETQIPYAITIVQSFLLLSGIYLFARGIFSGESKFRLVGATLPTYAFVHGFSMAILQQALIVFLSGVLVYGIFSPGKHRHRILVVLLSLLLLTLTSTVVAVGALALIFLYLLLNKDIRWKTKILASVSSFLVVLLVFLSWTGFKQTFDDSSSNYQGQRYFWEMDDYNSFVLPDKILAIPSVIGALNSIGVEFYYGDYFPAGAETRLFGVPTLREDQVCGRLFPGPVEYLSKSNLNSPSYCVNSTVLWIGSKVNTLLGYLLPICSMLGFGLLVGKAFRAFRRKAHLSALAMLAGQILLIPFWFGNVAISRLGLVALITNLLILFIALGSPKKRISELKSLLG